MIFNSKQLEELENIHDSTGAFEEEGDEEAGFDEVGEAAMDWRRSLIEEAAENIKRAKTRPVEPHIQYNIGSMLFDRDARRFARVQRSVPGYLKIAYLSGGDREFGALDVTGYLRDQGAQKRLSELAEQLGMPDADVGHELERLGITPLEEPEAEATPADAADAAPARGQKKGAPAPADNGANGVHKAVNGKQARVAQKAQKAAPPPAKAARPAAPAAAPAGRKAAETQKPQKAPQKAQKPAAKPAAGARPSGKGVNPIDDPNGYIKANFQQMSNRELARLTGLSEHTIRRKLGEWGLKRKKEV